MFLQSKDGYYNMILMDMMMPVMDGCKATKKIRASGRKDSSTIRIIAITANVMKEDVEKVYAAGMDNHLGKPIDITAMNRILDIALK